MPYKGSSRNKRKQKKKTRKAWQRAKADHLDTVRKEFQEYILHTDSKMEITSIVREREGVYKIFYVSDNQFPDWDQFPEFLSLIKLHHPKWQIYLRRVRNSTAPEYRVDEKPAFDSRIQSASARAAEAQSASFEKSKEPDR